MNLARALNVATQLTDINHPATIRQRLVSPNLRMIQAKNGQFLTSSNYEGIKNWTFEEFVAEFCLKQLASGKRNEHSF